MPDNKALFEHFAFVSTSIAERYFRISTTSSLSHVCELWEAVNRIPSRRERDDSPFKFVIYQE